LQVTVTIALGKLLKKFTGKDRQKLNNPSFLKVFLIIVRYRSVLVIYALYLIISTGVIMKSWKRVEVPPKIELPTKEILSSLFYSFFKIS